MGKSSEKLESVFVSTVPSDSYGQSATVNLVSHVHGFFPGGRLVEINTSLESSWSPIFISVGFNLNRGQLDGLEQVIDCAARSVNRFLQPGVYGQ